MAGGEPGIMMTEIKWEIRMNAERSRLDELLDRLDADLEVAGCPKEKRTEIGICAEEVFVNIANYAYPDTGGNVLIEERIHENMLSLIFKDSGIPFDPLKHGNPDTTLPESERKIGGLGIYMVRNMTDRIWYVYQDGMNCLYLEYIWKQVQEENA